MRLKNFTGNRCNKRGSYIVEASISLPVFLVAVLALSSIILMYACIEDSNYILADELGRASIESVFVDTSLILPGRVVKRIKNNQSIAKQVIPIELLYREKCDSYDELIAMTLELKMNSPNPFSFASKGEYTLSYMTRAYVGKVREESAMSDEELSDEKADIVYIFPNRGEKYHNDGCGVLHASYTGVILSSSVKSKYHPCKICKSKSAGMGSLVYIFPDEGESYHIIGCEALERNYVEVDKNTAIKRGYEVCLKCGG